MKAARDSHLIRQQTDISEFSWMISILSHCSCSILFFRYDYLVIRNENGADFGTYCGSRAWTTVVVNGTNVVLTFHSDSRNNGGRFRLLFNPIYRK